MSEEEAALHSVVGFCIAWLVDKPDLVAGSLCMWKLNKALKLILSLNYLEAIMVSLVLAMGDQGILRSWQYSFFPDVKETA